MIEVEFYDKVVALIEKMPTLSAKVYQHNIGGNPVVVVKLVDKWIGQAALDKVRVLCKSWGYLYLLTTETKCDKEEGLYIVIHES